MATQKPAGIVNDQIRSNSKFGICLKVQDKEDSFDVIKRPDAASLKGTGQFFMQVGNDEYFTLGQSAYTGFPYIPSDMVKKKIDTSIDFISNTGMIIKKIEDSTQKVVHDKGDQLTNIVRYLHELAKEEHIKAEQLWLENVPENIFIDDLRKKYKVQNDEKIIDPVIGEYDDPFNQNQGVVKLDISNGGNTVIFGSADSGKETLLSTIVYDTINNYSSEKIQLYILDFGSEALKIFKGAPHVGDIVFANEEEKIKRFFDMLTKEMSERKEILSEYNGDYKLYNEKNKNTMPQILVIINNYEVFSENYINIYEDLFQMLTREGTKFGIAFIITTSAYNDIRYRMAKNFKKSIALQLNNEDDYFSIFEHVGKKRPSHIFGRGLVEIEDQIYEYQTAKICEPEKYNEQIAEIIKKAQKTNKIQAKNIPILPSKVTFEDVNEQLEDLAHVPLGIESQSLQVHTYNFKKNFMDIIVSKNIEDIIEYTSYLIDELNKLNDTKITVFKAESLTRGIKSSLKNEFEEFLEDMERERRKNTMCVIIGIDKFLTDVEIDEREFLEILKKFEQDEKCNFIIAENAIRLKNHEYDEWYKTYVTGDTGIWIGNGITDQYLISLNNNITDKAIVNNCGRNFGYVIRQGNATAIKLLGMKSEGDDIE